MRWHWLTILLCPWRHGEHWWTESALLVNHDRKTERILQHVWCENCGKVKWRK